MKNQPSYVRKLYKRMPSVIAIPQELQNRPVEVLLLPLENDGEINLSAEAAHEEWRRSAIERTAGQWAGDPLVRESQGDYETRDSLD